MPVLCSPLSSFRPRSQVVLGNGTLPSKLSFVELMHSQVQLGNEGVKEDGHRPSLRGQKKKRGRVAPAAFLILLGKRRSIVVLFGRVFSLRVRGGGLAVDVVARSLEMIHSLAATER